MKQNTNNPAEEAEEKRRIQAGWNIWRKVTDISKLLCDRNASNKVYDWL